MITDCITSRPDLTWEVKSKKTILLIDMACPNENNKMPIETKRLGSTIDYALNYENDEKVIGRK